MIRVVRLVTDIGDSAELPICRFYIDDRQVATACARCHRLLMGARDPGLTEANGRDVVSYRGHNARGYVAGALSFRYSGLQLLVEVDVLRLQREEFGERLGHRLVAAAHVETHGVL